MACYTLLGAFMALYSSETNRNSKHMKRKLRSLLLNLFSKCVLFYSVCTEGTLSVNFSVCGNISACCISWAWLLSYWHFPPHGGTIPFLSPTFVIGNFSPPWQFDSYLSHDVWIIKLYGNNFMKLSKDHSTRFYKPYSLPFCILLEGHMYIEEVMENCHVNRVNE